MTTTEADGDSPVRNPRILVFSTNTISDPGIDLAGKSDRSHVVL